jgi:hypothetical protein
MLVALGAGACGGSGASTHRAGKTLKSTSTASHSSKVSVVRAWSADLLGGHIDAAAAHFAVPSLFENGQAVEIRSVADARAVNASLPCGAKYVSATWTGRYVNVLFRLTGRPGPGGTSCSGGVGQTARTAFLIAHGKIVAWIRAPDVAPKPGSGSGAPNPSPPSPTQSAST